jgi:hypothetical protein
MKVLSMQKESKDAVDAARGTGFSTNAPTRQDDAEEEEIPAPRATARESYGWNRDQDEVILKAVNQPGANPQNPTFWVRLAATVLSPLLPSLDPQG